MVILNNESAIAYAKDLFASYGNSYGTTFTVGEASPSLESSEGFEAIDVEVRDGSDIPFPITVWIEQGEAGPYLYGEW